MPERERRLTTIVAIDVAGYSRLMHADETGTLDRLRAARTISDPIGVAHGARIVGTWGDGLLAEFPSVVEAVEFARKAQAAMVEFNEGTPEDQQLLYRIGINLGDVIVEAGDLFGDGVNVAARLEALAPPGGIVLSGAAYEQVRDKLDISFTELGEVEVKNIARPVRAFEVSNDREAPLQAVTPGRRRWPALVGIAVVLVLLIAGGAWWYAQLPEFEPADPAKMAYALDEPSIAVLALNNLTGDPEQEHVSDGLSEDIITTLARLPGIVVIARSSSFTYKGKPVDVRKVAEELSVRYVLEGSLQSFGEKVRVTVQLIDAVSGHHVWAQKYDRPRTDFFAVRDEITHNIIAELNSELLEGNAWGSKLENFKRIETWLLGRKALWHAYQFNKADNQVAIDLFHKIIESEPESAWAHALLAFRYAWIGRAGWGDDREAAFRLAAETAEKAISLDDRSPMGYSGMAFVRFVEARFEDAIAYQKKALEHAPGDAEEIALLAIYLQRVSEVDRSVELFERAARLHRKAPGWFWSTFADAYRMAGRCEEAVSKYQIALTQGAVGVLGAEANLGLAVCYDALGRDGEARNAIAEAIEALPEVSVAFVRRTFPFTDQEYMERWLATLARLGLPEE